MDVSDDTARGLGVAVGAFGAAAFLYKAVEAYATARRIASTPEYDPAVHSPDKRSYVRFHGAVCTVEGGGFASVWEGEPARLVAVRYEEAARGIARSIRDSVAGGMGEAAQRTGSAKAAEVILMESVGGERVRLRYRRGEAAGGSAARGLEENVLWVEGVPMRRERGGGSESRGAVNVQAGMRERYGLPVGEWFTAYGQVLSDDASRYTVAKRSEAATSAARAVAEEAGEGEAADAAEEAAAAAGEAAAAPGVELFASAEREPDEPWQVAIGAGDAGPLHVTFESPEAFASEFWWNGTRLALAGVGLGACSLWLFLRAPAAADA